MAFANVFNPKALATIAAALTVATGGIAHAQVVKQDDGSIKTTLDQAKEDLASGKLQVPPPAKPAKIDVSLTDQEVCTIDIQGMTGVGYSDLKISFGAAHSPNAIYQKGDLLLKLTREVGKDGGSYYAVENFSGVAMTFGQETEVQDAISITEGLSPLCKQAHRKKFAWVTPDPTKKN